MLIARNEEKLRSCCETIQSTYKNIKVEYFVCDFMELRKGTLRSELDKRLDVLKRDGGIGVLINNVGVSYPFAQYFHELDESRSDAMVCLC